MTQQIEYLEKLLEGYKERFKRGERDLMPRIQATSAQLDEAKIRLSYEQAQKAATPQVRESILMKAARGCCRSR